MSEKKIIIFLFFLTIYTYKQWQIIEIISFKASAQWASFFFNLKLPCFFFNDLYLLIIDSISPKESDQEFEEKTCIKIQADPKAFMPPPPPAQLIFKLFEGIWNNYVDIQQKNIQVRFFMFLRGRGYNSLSHPALHYKVWSINMSKCKTIQNWSTRSADSGQIIHYNISKPIC